MLGKGKEKVSARGVREKEGRMRKVMKMDTIDGINVVETIEFFMMHIESLSCLSVTFFFDY